MQVVTYLHAPKRGPVPRTFVAGSPPYIRLVARTRISRSFASVLSLWLAVCMAEPVQLHTCAMHGGLAIEQTSGSHAQSAMSHSMATHPAAGHSHHDQNNDGQSQQCSCLGDCNAGSGPLGVLPVVVSLLSPVVRNRPSAGFDYSSPRLVAPNFLLPFGNGPPTGSSRA